MNTGIMKKLIAMALMVTGIFAFITPAQAGPIFNNGSGAISTVDHIATFDALTAYGSADLSTYTEGGLNVQTPASVTSYPLCSGCWYANGGYDSGVSQSASLARISTVSGSTMAAVEFNMFSGFSIGSNTIVWETYLAGGLTGTGSAIWLGYGSLVGWLDTAGIDELRVGLFDNSGILSSNTENFIGLDNLKVELNASVPEPTILTLFSLGLVGLGFIRRRQLKV
jgi:hypothetical protein